MVGVLWQGRCASAACAPAPRACTAPHPPLSTAPARRPRPLPPCSCAVACLAQFYPKKYPDNFWVLAGCVATYVVLSSLMSGAGT